MQQNTLITWLKAILIFFALSFSALIFLFLPAAGYKAAGTTPEAAFLYWPCLLFLWVLSTPIYLMLREAWKVCCRIAKGEPFCGENARSFIAIGQYSLMDCGLLFVGNIALAITSAVAKIPAYPLMIPILSAILIFIGLALAVAAATLSHLIYKACDIHEENQLTI